MLSSLYNDKLVKLGNSHDYFDLFSVNETAQSICTISNYPTFTINTETLTKPN